jgi:hypothetical protein
VCSEALKRRKSGKEREGERKKESKRESRERVQLFAAIAAQGKLPGADPSVVLCELGKGFKSL